MKTTARPPESLDDLVFSGRNQDYGAYHLRKNYDKAMNLALILASLLLVLGISIPLIASYNNHKRVLTADIESIRMITLDPPPEEMPPPPPPPPLDIALDKSIRFVPPIVTNDTASDSGFGNQDDLNRRGTNPPLDTTTFVHLDTKKSVVFDPPKEKEIYTSVEEMPAFIGGEAARLAFLGKNLIYPALARSTDISGTVYIEFVVDEKGNIMHLHLLKGIGGGCDEEAMRVIRLMTWKPGRQNGQPVPVRFTMPIKFILQ